MIQRATFLSLILSLLLFCGASQLTYAQDQRDYTLATQMMKQQRYQQAAEILVPLLKEQPASLPIYQQTMESLIQLKEYQKAMVLTKESLRNGLSAVQGDVKLAELHHLDGSSEKAIEIWNSILEEHSNLGTYLTVARSMKDRGEYNQAISVYETAQQKFENGRLFLHEVAYTYLLAGEYEPAMRSFVQLIIQNPRRFGYVQRNLQRYSDEALFDAAIIETEEVLNQGNYPPEVFNQLVQLDLWLLMERELYDRAISSVSSWVRQEKAGPFLLVDLGRRLRGVMAFSAATKAFERAKHFSTNDIKATAQFEQSKTLEQWAVQERHQNRMALVDADSLYQRAQQNYMQLLQDHPYFNKRTEIYGALSELALDVQQDTTSAQRWLNELEKELPDPENSYEYNYLKGKIALYKRDFMDTRIRLTRALKVQKSSHQREHMRYLLGLADFYEGDYEFARTQLDALKQQSTSLFANDALQLKLWLNEGGFADSTGQSLHWLAQLHQQSEHRNFDQALVSLDSLRNSPAGSVLEDDALYLLSQSVPENRVTTYFLELNQYLQQSPSTPLHERLLWERIQRVEQLISQEKTSNHVNQQQLDTESDLPESQQDLVRLVEELLNRYPQGFYAGQARQKLRNLSESQPASTS